MRLQKPWVIFVAALILATVVYVPGLSGGWLFDDYGNIVLNRAVQVDNVSVSSLTKAALSSPSSRFKRPLASLTFAFNYLVGGLNPFGWKLVNLIIHLLNGLVMFLLARRLVGLAWMSRHPSHGNNAKASEVISGKAQAEGAHTPKTSTHAEYPGANLDQSKEESAGIIAALIAGAWMLLPINLTAVLYVVQRMESLANLFVLLGLLGYVFARQRMQAGRRGLWLCVVSLITATVLGITAKETAVMLPLYAFLVECIIFRFQSAPQIKSAAASGLRQSRWKERCDWNVVGLFAALLFVPLILGLSWIVPQVIGPGAWASRDFTLVTRVMTEWRIVLGYIAWTFLPLSQWLSFYHDDVALSQSLLQPWTTIPALLGIAALLAFAWWQRQRRPLVALGVGLYFGCHLLTGTILPLELVYEHRNYFASFGLMLAAIPWLLERDRWLLVKRTLLVLLAVCWVSQTAFTAYQWGGKLRMASALASRAPESPRAQYAFGHLLMIGGGYNPDSPFTKKAYVTLKRAASLQGSSILPLRALLLLDIHAGKTPRTKWWNQLITRLKVDPPSAEDISAIAKMAECAGNGKCKFKPWHMLAALDAVMAHPSTDAILYVVYAKYAWRTLGNQGLGFAKMKQAVARDPDQPAFHHVLGRMAIAMGRPDVARAQIDALERINYAGRVDDEISELKNLLKEHVSKETGDDAPET